MPVSFDSTDLDNAASETGVVHESVANTDHDDASVLKQGYPLASPSVSANSVQVYYPHHETSGTTLYDVSGNNTDGSISGSTVNQTGLLNTPSHSMDGVDDQNSTGSVGGFDAYTVSMWAIFDDLTADRAMWTFYDGGEGFLYYDNSVDRIAWAGGSGAGKFDSNISPNTGEWYHLVAISDPSSGNREIWIDGTLEGSDGSAGATLNTQSHDIGHQGGSKNHSGRLCYWVLYDTVLTSSEIQTLYDVVNTSGEIITSSKVS